MLGLVVLDIMEPFKLQRRLAEFLVHPQWEAGWVHTFPNMAKVTKQGFVEALLEKPVIDINILDIKAEVQVEEVIGIINVM